jgi:hypothetical protein
MNAKQHLQKLNEYRSRAAAIESDGRYTNAGKEPMIQALVAEMDQQINRLMTDLQSEYTAMHKEYDSAAAAIGQARAEHEAGWDYPRLSYVKDAIKAQVQGARDVGEVEQLYKTAAGDNYKIKAWGEVGIGEARARFGVEAAQIVTDAQRAAEALANTPAMLKAQQGEAVAAQRMYDLRADTLGIVETLNTLGRGYQSYMAQELASTIRISSKGELGGGYVLSFAGID